MVNLPSLLHQVNDAKPNSFQIRTAPTVLFTRSSTIGSKVFNYKDVVETIDSENWNVDLYMLSISPL